MMIVSLAIVALTLADAVGCGGYSGRCPFARRRRRGGVVVEVEAHITGIVWKIECKVGDVIEEGDTVVTLESMKMEMPVEAEDPGVVREILCEEGQPVDEGDTLVVLE
jgi:acetyl-CoA carboxylase biotin carboxyl carrier protein